MTAKISRGRPESPTSKKKQRKKLSQKRVFYNRLLVDYEIEKEEQQILLNEFFFSKHPTHGIVRTAGVRVLDFTHKNPVYNGFSWEKVFAYVSEKMDRYGHHFYFVGGKKNNFFQHFVCDIDNIPPDYSTKEFIKKLFSVLFDLYAVVLSGGERNLHLIFKLEKPIYIGPISSVPEPGRRRIRRLRQRVYEIGQYLYELLSPMIDTSNFTSFSFSEEEGYVPNEHAFRLPFTINPKYDRKVKIIFNPKKPLISIKDPLDVFDGADHFSLASLTEEYETKPSPPKTISPRYERAMKHIPFSSLPYFKALKQTVIPTGFRNQVTTSIAIALKAYNFPEERAFKIIQEEFLPNYSQSGHPFTTRDIHYTISSIYRREKNGLPNFHLSPEILLQQYRNFLRPHLSLQELIFSKEYVNSLVSKRKTRSYPHQAKDLFLKMKESQSRIPSEVNNQFSLQIPRTSLSEIIKITQDKLNSPIWVKIKDRRGKPHILVFHKGMYSRYDKKFRNILSDNHPYMGRSPLTRKSEQIFSRSSDMWYEVMKILYEIYLEEKKKRDRGFPDFLIWAEKLEGEVEEREEGIEVRILRGPP